VTEPLSGVRPAEERAATSGGLLRAVPLGTRPETRGQALQLPPLMLGQRLAAEVVGQLPGGRYLIAVQGALLEATAPQTLRTGSTLNVRVHQLQPQIIFQMDPEPEDDLQAEVEQILRARLPHQTPSGEALQGLRQALSSAGGAALQGVPRELLARLQGLLERLFPHGAPPDLDFLLRVLRDGGLHYEAKLAHLAGQDPRALAGLVDTDLKAALLQALKELQAAPMNAQMQRLAGVFTSQLDQITTQQAANVLAQTRGEAFQLQIPVFIAQQLATLFLAIEADGRGAHERKGRQAQGHHVFLRLDLEGLGLTRIYAYVKREALTAVFYLEPGRALPRLRAALPEFRDILLALGYVEVLLEAKPLAQLSPEKRQKFEALTIGVPTTVHLVDVRA